MRRLTPEELKSRLRLDFQVFQRMQGTIFTGEAYRSKVDLDGRRNPITSVDQGHLATKYRVDFHVKTLIGPGRFANLTTIGVDLEVGNYPNAEPATWVITKPVPYSPHFKEGYPVCLGETWERSKGWMLLGQLLVHTAKLLNWDEIGRGGGYAGWNRAAIDHHQQVYHGRPITPDLVYPMVPPEFYGIAPSHGQPSPGGRPSFTPLGTTASPYGPLSGARFKGKGSEPRQ